VVGIVENAGQQALRSLAAAALVGELKADSTVVTRLDREMEQLLEPQLRELDPGAGFLGEEYGFRGASRERLWVVDPIDGTANLVHGIPMWGIAVGLLEAQESVLGVFHLPLLGETFAAATGQGAVLNGVPLAPQDIGELASEDTLVATSRSLRRVDFVPVQGRLRALGSICAELCYAAAGRFAGCISMGDKLTDMVAPVCVCREAGLRLEWLSGGSFHFEGMEERLGHDALVVAPEATNAYLRGNLSLR
ncbi:MAG TPA: inositol monophosphatase family protein, partial [Armatimonadota bacterium]